MAREKRKSNEEIKYDVLVSNTRELMKTSYGKEFVWYILGLCGLYSETFTGNSQTFYNEGKRSIGLDLLSLLDDADPTIYPRLVIENIDNNKGD